MYMKFDGCNNIVKNYGHQEIIKVRGLIPHIGPLTKVIHLT